MNTKILGRQGEDIAAGVLRKSGYKILARNFRVPVGELDLVAQDGEVIVFVEVKTRRGNRCGTPGQSVDWRKQQKLLRAAEWYLQQNRMDGESCRFDVMEVYIYSETHWDVRQIKGAFEAGRR